MPSMLTWQVQSFQPTSMHSMVRFEPARTHILLLMLSTQAVLITSYDPPTLMRPAMLEGSLLRKATLRASLAALGTLLPAKAQLHAPIVPQGSSRPAQA
jgi:hypothetical protein